MSETNSVLYGDDNTSSSCGVFENVDKKEPVVMADNVSGENTRTDNSGKGTGNDNAKEPTNRDILNFLQKIENRIETVESRLSSLKGLEDKLGAFEKDLKEIKSAFHTQTKQTIERFTKLEDKVDGVDMSTALLTSRVEELEKERQYLKDDVAYLKSQSMRNNLIFTGVPEIGTNEGFEQTEAKLRQHLVDALKLTKEEADNMRFERVHRSPSEPISGRTRSIVAKFTYFKDREHVRKQWKHLSGTHYNVFEQFPQEVVAKRKRLVPKMKEARRQGKRSWIVFDTLYIDGKPVKSD